MRRFAVLLIVGSAAVTAALGGLACGGDSKPPLTPDPTDHSLDDAGAAPAPAAAPPAK